ncbi:MAG TPA: hypothetical protein VMX13_04465 [Sedimentisphaerales bacterium]|nr:hypothetical protein [Sedimentisphaerales bacterium]
MTLYSLVSKIMRFFSWLHTEHQWAKWVLLAAAGMALVMLVSTVAAAFRARAARAGHLLQRKYWRQI